MATDAAEARTAEGSGWGRGRGGAHAHTPSCWALRLQAVGLGATVQSVVMTHWRGGWGGGWPCWDTARGRSQGTLGADGQAQAVRRLLGLAVTGSEWKPAGAGQRERVQGWRQAGDGMGGREGWVAHSSSGSGGSPCRTHSWHVSWRECELMKCLKGGKTRIDLIFKDLWPRAGQAVTGFAQPTPLALSTQLGPTPGTGQCWLHERLEVPRNLLRPAGKAADVPEP